MLFMNPKQHGSYPNSFAKATKIDLDCYKSDLQINKGLYILDSCILLYGDHWSRERLKKRQDGRTNMVEAEAGISRMVNLNCTGHVVRMARRLNYLLRLERD